MKTRFKLTVLKEITFSGVPRETFSKGEALTGEIVRINHTYLVFLPEEVERSYQFPLDSISYEELKNECR